jgi:hypothetical protein
MMHTSCKFMSCTKMLYMLIRNSLTGSCHCTYMLNKNKYCLMCFLPINAMFRLKKQTWGWAYLFNLKTHKCLSDSNEDRSATSLVCFYILHINDGAMKDKV